MVWSSLLRSAFFFLAAGNRRKLQETAGNDVYRYQGLAEGVGIKAVFPGLFWNKPEQIEEIGANRNKSRNPGTQIGRKLGGGEVGA